MTADSRRADRIAQPGAPGIPADLVGFIDRLPRHGRRRAYLWREGVRWRTRTYDELHRRIGACAATLAAAGVGAGDPVLLQGPESADWIEALLGTLLAGGVAVPLDAGAPAGFREKVARKVGARVLIAPSSVDPPGGIRRILLGSWSDAAGPPPRATPAPGDRAEIIFTSGTTGDPKGVVLTHGNLASDFAPVLHAYLARRRLVAALGELRCLSTLPLSHMFGQALSVFIASYLGLTVVLTPPRPREILEAAGRRRAWALFTVPRLLDLLAAEVRRLLAGRGLLESFDRRRERLAGRPFWFQALAFPAVRRLFGWRFRLLVVGGAPLPEPVQQFWERCGYLLIQGYGLTETAPIVAISNPFERRAGSVGKPLGIQEVRLGPGGEVQVRGPNVTPGYLGAADEGMQDGWFRTGDVGEFDTQGRLRIRGRLKDMIVTPEGENVYPVDVESAFRDLPGVRDVAVLGLPLPGGERVHAVLLLERDAGAAAIVARANERLLPRQRVRGHTVWPGDDFPRTATGKVKKGVLRERALQSETAGTGGPAGAEGMSSVRLLVSRTAGVRPETLTPATRLVEGLGLASLDLVELAVAIEEELGVSVPEELLATASIGDLESLAASGGAAAVTAATPVPAADMGGTADIGGVTTGGPPGGLQMPRWARGGPVHAARRLLEETLYRAVVFGFAWPQVRGLERLRGVPPPYLLVANHHSYLDTGLFKGLLPRPLRGRIAPGMTTRHHRLAFGERSGGRGRFAIEWFQVRLVQFLFHAWPLPETAGFRHSLAYAGELMDEGYSILIFPEGRHLPEGTAEPFRKGIGIFARELRAPVVPAAIEGTGRVLPDWAWLPRFGRTRLLLGAPLRIGPEEEAGEATRRIETAVRELQNELRAGGPPRRAGQGAPGPP
ncbi:MAG: AMP-binding protein [Candidatus Polarisedimenticolia bacterium]